MSLKGHSTIYILLWTQARVITFIMSSGSCNCALRFTSDFTLLLHTVLLKSLACCVTFIWYEVLLCFFAYLLLLVVSCMSLYERTTLLLYESLLDKIIEDFIK